MNNLLNFSGIWGNNINTSGIKYIYVNATDLNIFRIICFFFFSNFVLFSYLHISTKCAVISILIKSETNLKMCVEIARYLLETYVHITCV